jgi:protein-disulfide isomerase
MTSPSPSETASDTPSFSAALKNRKIQMLLGLFVATTAAVSVALASQVAEPAITSRAQIEQIVHDYILEHPEILPQALERLQAKRIGSAIDARRSEIETPFAGAWDGAQNSDVVLVEFFDYACGYCRSSLPEIAKLAGEDGKLKIVYRELPILSEDSNAAAHVSLLAAERGNYMAFHKALYGEGRVTRDSILKAAASDGIDRKAAETAIADKRYAAEIEKNIRLAQALGANGTPTFIVGGQMLAGAVGYDGLKKAVEEERAKGKKGG